ncbi:MAG: hypothetical protein WCO51_00625 [bacterium]
MLICDESPANFGGYASQGAVGWVLWGREEPPGTPAHLLALSTGRRFKGEIDDAQIMVATARLEADFARQAFKRRTGIIAPKESYIALNMVSLKSRGILRQIMGARLEEAKKQARALRIPGMPLLPTALPAINTLGFAPLISSKGDALPISASQFTSLNDDLLVIYAPNPAGWLKTFLPPSKEIARSNTDIYVVCLPREVKQHFTRCLFIGPHWPSGTLKSPTTRWSGLIAETNIAPTILNGLGVFSPNQSLASFKAGNGEQIAYRFGVWQQFQQRFGVRMLLIIGIIVGIWLSFRVINWTLTKRRPSSLTFELCFLAAIPAGMTVAGLLPVPSVFSYLSITVLSSALVALASITIGRKSSRLPLNLAALFSLGIILIDSCSGLHGVRHSFFGLYLYSGARIYGLDNDYLGYLVALGIWSVAGWMAGLRMVKITGKSLLLVAAFFAVLALLLGLPNIGANAGGIAAAVAGLFGAAHLFAGKRLRWVEMIALLLLGAACAISLGIFELSLYGASSSHMGNAVLSVTSRGLAGFIGLFSNQSQSLLRIVYSPFMLLTIICFVLFFYGVWRWQGDSVKRIFKLRPALKLGAYASLWSALTCILFNDSGFISASVILAASFIWIMNWMIRDT